MVTRKEGQHLPLPRARAFLCPLHVPDAPVGPQLSPEVVKGQEQWGGVGQALQEVVTVSEELQTADWPVGERGRLCGPERHKLGRLRASN